MVSLVIPVMCGLITSSERPRYLGICRFLPVYTHLDPFLYEYNKTCTTKITMGNPMGYSQEPKTHDGLGWVRVLMGPAEV